MKHFSYILEGQHPLFTLKQAKALLRPGSVTKTIIKDGLRHLIRDASNRRPATRRLSNSSISEVAWTLTSNLEREDLIPIPHVIEESVASSVVIAPRIIVSLVTDTLYRFVSEFDGESRMITRIYQSIPCKTCCNLAGATKHHLTHLIPRLGVQLCQLLQKKGHTPSHMGIQTLQTLIAKYFFPKRIMKFVPEPTGQLTVSEVPFTLSALISDLESGMPTERSHIA